jgi:hypothetical protein
MSLTPEDLPAVVARHVDAVEAIDVHTHLLPPTHADLLPSGVDEMMTYHYLVAELFMVLPACESEEDSATVAGATPQPPPSPDEFFSWPKPRQADLVFEELFVKRTPISEACRGVITALGSLGLGSLLREARGATGHGPSATSSRLAPLRAWFASQPLDAHMERVFVQAKLKYAVMTNIPFVPEEAVHWFPSGNAAEQGGPATPLAHMSPRLRPALRVDPLLSADWPVLKATLARATPPYPPTCAGLRRFLKDWVGRMRPLYLMASTPAGFTYVPTPRQPPKRKRNDDAQLAPEASRTDSQDSAAAEKAAQLPGAAVLLEEVLIPTAIDCKLAIALKVGAVRGANPALRTGGDGVEVADLSFIWKLCKLYPNVKFLLTVLSAVNQHELCVLARKFGNLHVYGCWWFCNNPSIIETTTRMRLEMLGTAFTCQHSDARVLEQLLYKWQHSREAIAPVLAAQYAKLLRAGWELTEGDVQRDVELLFGGAFEAFLAK